MYNDIGRKHFFGFPSKHLVRREKGLMSSGDSMREVKRSKDMHSNGIFVSGQLGWLNIILAHIYSIWDHTCR